jgi:hypothetical protein
VVWSLRVVSASAEQARRQHKVARGEYLFKILRNHDYTEAEAQVAMDIMGQDAKGFGITSGSVHVVYPGDLIALPTLDEVRQTLAVEVAAEEERTQSLLADVEPAAPAPAPAGMPAVANLPSIDPQEIQAAVEVLEEGSLDRLGELLTMFNQRPRPGPLPPARVSAPAPFVERRNSQSGGALRAPSPAPLNLPMQGAPVKVGDLMARFGRPGPSVVRPAKAPRWARDSAMSQLPRYGEPFQYRYLEDYFNLHRPYHADAPEAWFHYHRCPNCASGSAGMCVLVKLLSIADLWEDVASAFGSFDPDS